MTCVAGMVQNDVVYMAADSMAADGWNQRITLLPKIFVIRSACGTEFLIG